MSKPNAYSLFVKDIAKRRQERGDTGIIFSSLFKELSSDWTNLPSDQKQRYKDRAKVAAERWASNKTSYSSDYRAGASYNNAADIKLETNHHEDERDSKPNINGTSGVDLKPDVKTQKRLYEGASSSSQDEKRLKPYTTPNRINNINCNYRDFNLLKIGDHCKSIVASRESKLTTTPLYSISVNVLCKHKKDSEDIFVPIEISIYAYSLKDGKIGNPYHVIINSDSVPTGYVNKANDHATDTHKISFPPSGSWPENSRKDYKRIYKEILEYVKAGERVVLIQNARDLAQVTSSLNWLHKKATDNGGKVAYGVKAWTVLPVTTFVTTMYNYIYEEMLTEQAPMHAPFALHYYINMLLDSSIMDYNTSLMCDYHGQDDKQTKWCAQSCAIKTFVSLEHVLEEICNKYEYAVKSANIQLTGPVVEQAVEPIQAIKDF